MSFEIPRRRALDRPLRPTRAEVSVAALEHNLAAVRALAPECGVLAVVKANAYGHGAVQVARVLEHAGVEMLAVALVEEGLELRHAGVKAPILVMGGSYEGGYELMVANDLTPTLFRLEHIAGLARAAAQEGKRAKAHLKLDTGMGRLGVQPLELPIFLDALTAASTHVQLDGYLSHFASADVPGAPGCDAQVERYERGLEAVTAAGFSPRWKHLANSAGALAVAAARAGPSVNLIRPGLALYGVLPDAWLDGRLSLTPALSWKTGITHLKTIEEGTALSYGGTWLAKRRSVVATLPVGYADGYGRIFSNRGEVLLRGQRAPIVGRVTMDMCLIDVTDIAGVAVGDEVVLLGSQQGQHISAVELASRSETIPYEVLCGVGARVPRILT